MLKKWIILLVMFYSASLFAVTEDTARVLVLRGTATATDPVTDVSRILRKDSLLEAGDVIETGPKGLMKIVYPDKSVIFMKSDSKIKIKEMSFNESKPEDDAMVTDVLKGSLRALTGVVGKRNPEKTKYNTAVSTIGIRGTAIRLDEQADDSWQVIFDIGSGYASNNGGTVEIGLDKALNIKNAEQLGEPVAVEQDPNDPAQTARFLSDMSQEEVQRFVEAACNNMDESTAMMLTSMQAQLSGSAKKNMVATTAALSKCLPPEVMAKVISFDSLIKADLAEDLFIASVDGGMDIETALESVMTGVQDNNPQITKRVLASAVKRGLTLDQAKNIQARISNMCL